MMAEKNIDGVPKWTASDGSGKEDLAIVRFYSLTNTKLVTPLDQIHYEHRADIVQYLQSRPKPLRFNLREFIGSSTS